ncbi:MAG: L-rhamnose isomerase [Trueperaceae bacterium]|nr:L-rhamnose isomerase [Trueperaceae bacterium]
MTDSPDARTGSSVPTDRALTHDEIVAALGRHEIETPSWGYGNSGTRFKTFPWPGAAGTVWEKIDDAAHVHALTGAAPGVAIHVPWDAVEDYDALGRYAEERGVRVGAVNPNLFQDDAYRLGSLTHPDDGVRRKALDRMRTCCDIMRATGSSDLSIWLADGTNYAGQDDLARRKAHLEEGLAETYRMLPEGARMLIEYKFFEPAFYHTDLADWGAAYATSLKCGPRAQVLVDTGHHPQGTNIPHIVAFLASEDRLGGFHFNARKYADDDLIVGSENPFELFDIYVKLIRSGRHETVAYMIDQSHNIEPKVEAMIQSILNCQTAYAKALSVDFGVLDRAQRDGDVLAAHRALTDAFETDVRPLLRELRESRGLDPDPIAAHRRSGYQERVAAARGTATAGGGYPSGG